VIVRVCPDVNATAVEGGGVVVPPVTVAVNRVVIRVFAAKTPRLIK
jgi:hypothetical protein